jgi:hypothetical protein
MCSNAVTEKAYEFIASETHNLYGCKTWSLTLREECRLRVFENRVLCRIFEPKRDKVIGDWRKLHNEAFNDLYCSTDIIQVIKLRMRWVGHVAHMGESRGAYRVLVGIPTGKRPLGRHRHAWEDTMEMDLQEVRCGGMNWMELAEKRDRWWVLVMQ